MEEVQRELEAEKGREARRERRRQLLERAVSEAVRETRSKLRLDGRLTPLPGGARVPLGALRRSEWEWLKRAYGKRCYYCQRQTFDLVIEHRVPLSRGGGNSVSNLVPACTFCNATKGRLTDEEYLEALTKLDGPWNRRQRPTLVQAIPPEVAARLAREAERRRMRYLLGPLRYARWARRRRYR